MDLLGTPALATSVLLVLLGVLGGTACQQLVRSRGVGSLLTRLVVTLLSCALVVAGIAVELNRENGWYASLGDLTGQQANGQGTRVVVGDQQHTLAGSALPPLPHPGQRLQSYQVTGSEGITSAVDVLLPPDYQQPDQAGHHYPVLVLSHGLPGNLRQWLGPIDIRKHLDPMVAAGQFADTIVVIPEIDAPGALDTECITGPNAADDAMEKWLARDVPAFVGSHFRVDSSPRAWATMGFSAGGWCSAMLTMLHPQTFSAAISLGGYFQPWWAGTAPWSSRSPRGRHYDLYSLAAHRPPAVALFVQSSRQDSESGPGTARFARAATAPLQVTEVMDATGGHRTDLWAGHVDQALAWLAHVRPAFA